MRYAIQPAHANFSAKSRHITTQEPRTFRRSIIHAIHAIHT
ncbi:hypothetical protein OFO07_07370 [Campylobacter sp. JMF_06 NA1]|nr:hypothetical protein [Campylobacter sp. JMF_06 NA1]MDA3078734.1 hypothetical protein [Campylobacter sp. JMF_06 NA1]